MDRADGSGQRVLDRAELDVARLAAEGWPRFPSERKRWLLELALRGGPPQGALGFSRWSCASLPATIPRRRAAIGARPGIFAYEASSASWIRWHLNFADPELFAFCGGDLFAQDEIQVAEHPALALLRQRLLAERRATRTVEGARPTPVLVSGVERRLAIDTRAIYGNALRRSSREELERAARVLTTPTRSHILAIAAPRHGYGAYRRAELVSALETATSGFRAAVIESRSLAPQARVEVVSGWWGCGAFGGNRVVMSFVQILAAHLADLDSLVLHTVESGSDAVDEARELVDLLAPPDTALSPALDGLVTRGFAWGQSDGN
jgi:hypothetical protein